MSQALAPSLQPGQLIVSIAAGITAGQLDRWLGGGNVVVRAMPNTPALLGAGVTGLFANERVSATQRARAEQVLASAGRTVWIEDEALIDAVTAVSGSGPAYVFLLAEAMAAAGAKLGLSPELAMRLARHTVAGAGELMIRSDEEPATLRCNVTSPNGTTAAALAVRVLDPQPGEAVADLCAAPGGKTLQLAAAGARVSALDISESRLALVAQNLDRCGLTARLVAGDALDWRPDHPLDAILLDAPCSATGTIRRHPELPLIRDGAALPGLVALQARLIDHALSLLKPGGRLVYATCSMLPQENERQVEAFLAAHPDFAVKPVDELWTSAVGTASPGTGPFMRLSPARHGTDGFFAAVLERGSAAE